MDYSYENLGPERFQEFCQALLTRQFPHMQCLPVAQPDGGRDAVLMLPPGRRDEFIVYQVKYARKPLAEKDPHHWLLNVASKEAPKIAQLLPKGVAGYYLLTNIPGTAHPEVGSIDQANQILREHFAVPAQCWWREDLNRRLEGTHELKWSYPELLTGMDALFGIIEGGLTEHKSRRTTRSGHLSLISTNSTKK